MTLKLYLDFLSQPSRALYIFFKINKVPFELFQVALQKGEHFSEEFKTNLNRFQKVPFIHDADFRLTESVAIIRYVSKVHNIDNNWYPKETKAQARVDEYLEWQHNNTRAFCALYFQRKWLFPRLTGRKTTPETMQKYEDNMNTCLDQIQNIWLADTPYLCGDRISVADIFAACEIEQPRIAGFDPTEGRPVLSAWINRVRSEASPFYEEAHVLLNKLVQKGGNAKL
ncbi:glutathione S-transferase theta-1 [Tribolium madens]|uniref:glutathione S-transferase theta-1 n=1 Tax=Tribolium madens TaxID=41895 RepID=UPI001CF73757|nr:glutathione S-transferase theta-1 [Tribolium madens]